MKITALTRSASSVQTPGSNVTRQPRNLDPALHQHEKAREYTRALNATKLDRIFAKPFVAQLGRGHVDGVYALAKDPKSLERLASASGDGVVKIWDLPTQGEMWQTQAHQNLVKGISWTQDQKLLSCGTDRYIKLWDPYSTASGSKPLATWTGPNSFSSLTMHRHERNFAVAASSSVQVFDVDHPSDTPLQSHAFTGAIDTITDLKFNQSETSILAAVSNDSYLTYYDLRTSSALHRQKLRMAGNSIAWNPIEPFNLAVGQEDHDINIFDMRNPTKALNTLKDHVSAVMCVDWSPTGQELVSASYDRSIRLWTPQRSGRSRDIYHTKRMQRVFSCTFTGDSTYVLSGSDDGNVRLWRAKASERNGIKSARERQALEYNQALQNNWKHMPEIKRIARHRHKPKVIKKAGEIKTDELNAIKRREENERKHSRAGQKKRRSEREKAVVAVEQ